jgi:hypothetical protein
VPTVTLTPVPGGVTSLTLQQALALVAPSGQPGAPCASTPGQACTAGGAVRGTGTVSGSMVWTLTANVPAGVAAGVIPVAVFSTTQGLQGFPCAPVAVGAPTVSCVGVTAGNALQGSTVTVVFAPGVVVVGTVTGPAGAPPAPAAPAAGAGAAPLLPPALVGLAPPPPLLPPPPPPPPVVLVVEQPAGVAPPTPTPSPGSGTSDSSATEARVRELQGQVAALMERLAQAEREAQAARQEAQAERAEARAERAALMERLAGSEAALRDYQERLPALLQELLQAAAATPVQAGE